MPWSSEPRAAVFRRQFVQLLLEFAVEREVGGRERVCELVEATGARNHWGKRGNPGLDREFLQLSFAQTAVSPPSTGRSIPAT